MQSNLLRMENCEYDRKLYNKRRTSFAKDMDKEKIAVTQTQRMKNSVYETELYNERKHIFYKTCH